MPPLYKSESKLGHESQSEIHEPSSPKPLDDPTLNDFEVVALRPVHEAQTKMSPDKHLKPLHRKKQNKTPFSNMAVCTP